MRACVRVCRCVRLGMSRDIENVYLELRFPHGAPGDMLIGLIGLQGYQK